MKKVGIMGGTFNPIHYGHLFLAENAYEQLNLDQILFMPSKNPPHKAKPNHITEQQRVDMVTLAIEDNPHFVLSTLELEREGMTFTADTLKVLTAQNPDKDYYFIVGADSLFMMQQWYDPQTIFRLSTIVVASRDHVNKKQLEEQISILQSMYEAKFIIIDMPTIQIASAVIRERVSKCKTIRYYLPDQVASYIKQNNLYMTALEDTK
jgi:nicotinate-nucleotide adenylyltransferase